MPLRTGRSATERLVRRPSSAQPGSRKLAGSRKTTVLKDIGQVGQSYINVLTAVIVTTIVCAAAPGLGAFEALRLSVPSQI